MSIDNAVRESVRALLSKDGYCRKPDVRVIAEECSDKVRQDLTNELDEVKRECQKLLEMNDRLWDTIHKISEPKFPNFRQLFKFRWLKFWK